MIMNASTSNAQPRTLVRASTYFLDVLAAWGIAIAQPLLSLLGSNTDFFIIYRVTPHEVLWFAIALAILPAILLCGVGLMLSAKPSWAMRFHDGCITILICIWLAQVLKLSLGLSGFMYVFLLVVIGIVLNALYRSFFGLRAWLRCLAIVPLLAVGMFLFASASGRYARASDVAVVQGTGIKTPIVMVMFDEFALTSLLNGAGDIDAVRFPNFARLKQSSTWFRDYSSTAEVTHKAIPAAISGVRPRSNASSTFADHPNSLFSLLGASHQMNVTEIITKLCPPNVCSGSKVGDAQRVSASANWTGLLKRLRSILWQRLDASQKNEIKLFEAFVPVEKTSAPATVVDNEKQEPRKAEIPAAVIQNFIALQQTENFNKWLHQVRPSAVPSFSYIHLLLPHQPWIYYPDGFHYSTAEKEWLKNETQWETDVKQQRSILQAQYVDTLVGQLLDQMQSDGLYKDSMVIFTADHGVSFDRGYNRRFASSDFKNASDLMHVPLFIHSAHQLVGDVSDENIENIDLVSVIAQRLKISVPWKTDGMLPASKTDAQKKIKTLYFVDDPYGSAKRTEKQLVVDNDIFLNEIKTAGTSLTDVNDILEPLYKETPFNELRGKEISSFTIEEGRVTATLDNDIVTQNPKVLVRGTFNQRVEADDWFAIVDGDRITGLSPTVTQKKTQRFVGLLPHLVGAQTTSLRMFRIIDLTHLEEISLGE
ncbi:MAG: hypothetical protein EXQ63_06340 [Ilumatobacteraceae bacterium]|nr:hypothetical protein [Ilumatobacteraceae bacterium]